MKVDSKYDWIVLGENPNALMSANLVARLGLSVLCVPLSKRMAPIQSESGQYLDPDTNLIAGMGTTQNGLVRALWSRITGPQDFPESEWIRERDIQCIEDDATRYSFLGDQWSWIDEWVREKGTPLSPFETLEKKAAQYWNEIPESFRLTRKDIIVEAKDGTKTTKTEWIRKVLKEPDWLAGSQALTDSSELLRLRRILVWLFSDSSFHALKNPRDQMKLFGAALQFQSFRGGIQNYIRFLKLSGRKLGVQYLEKGEVRQVFIDGGQFKGIQIAGVGELITATGAALGTSTDVLEGRVHWSGKEGFVSLEKSPEVTEFKMTIALTLKAEGVTEAHSRLQVLQEEEGLPLEMEWVAPTEYGIREPGFLYLFIRVPLPATSEGLSSAYQRSRAQRALRRWKEIFKFSDQHVLRIFPDPEKELDFKKVYGYASVRQIPENLRRYGRGAMGVKTGAEGLFRISSESYPSLGGVGGSLAAIEGTAWLAHKLGLEGPLV